jgi:hypothetical protein
MRMDETSARLHEWVESQAWIRFNKNLRRLPAAKREMLYQLAKRAVKQRG